MSTISGEAGTVDGGVNTTDGGSGTTDGAVRGTGADTTTAALLEAGAVLLPGSTARADADILTVRAYNHPALEGRQVVRLVPGTLGEAEDLALEFLGLTREPETPEVGQVRRETLGFPAWALVNDPANGHHALALVKDVERLARQAKSRPGHAKEGFEELGDRLGRAVPHFLPTFYEQAARIFLQHDNTTYAATFFGKAREAERVHALAVDEGRQRAVFLEFAFAGALTVKALKEHAKDLAGRLEPAAAWAQFRQLTVERCAAGVPPYASLPQDSRALIKAAGLDRVTEECAFLADLLASPAAVRAPASFWTAYRATLPVLTERRPAVRARLLEIMPSGLGRGVEDDEFWLALLAETGAERLLTGEAGAGQTDAGAVRPRPAEDGARAANVRTKSPSGYGAPDGDESPSRTDGNESPSGTGRVESPAADGGGIAAAVDGADWLSRWAAYRKHGGSWSRRSPATLALAARMAPRLRAAGRPVDLFTGRWHAGADLDLLDLCVAEGVPLSPPPDSDRREVHLALEHWLPDTRTPGRRDLAATAADPRFRALLHRAVGTLGKGHRLSQQVLTALAAHPVLREVLREWLEEGATACRAAIGLPAARAALALLQPFRAVAAEVAPRAVAEVAGFERAPLLGRTLRAGILDELGWPALEEALRLLDAETRKSDDDTLTVHEAWPELILARRRKAVVVGPEKVLLVHDLRLPDDLNRWQRPWLRHVDGELLVMWRQGSKQQAYWSSRPADVFTLGGRQIPGWWTGHEVDTVSIPLPGGGRATGGRALHAGDTDLPAGRAVLGDGTTYWRAGRQGRQSVWLEYDPATGTHGRASLPALLRSAVRDDATLLQDSCEVLPLRPGLENSPFGTDGTVLGRWVRRQGEGAEARTTAGTPDGRTVTLRADRAGHTPGLPLGALRLPGGAEPFAVRVHPGVALFAEGETSVAGQLGRVTPCDRGGEFAAGTRFVPPVAFWHALRPRDERGSAVLRGLGDQQAGKLLHVTAEALAERREALAAAGSDEAAKSAVPSVDEVSLGAVSRVLPELTDPRLLTGVASLVRSTLHLADAATTFTTPLPQPQRPSSRSVGMFADYSPEHGDDRTLHDACAGVAELHGWWGNARCSVLRQVKAVNHVLSARPAEGRPLPEPERSAVLGDGWRSEEFTVPEIGMVWPSVLSALRPLAYRAATPVRTRAEREALLLLLEAVLEGPLAAPGGVLREVVLTEPHTKARRGGQVLRRGDRTVVVLGCQSIDLQRDRANWLALDHDPSGRFGAVAHFTLDRETRHGSAITAEQLAAAVRLVRDKGAAPWRPDAVEALTAACGGGLGPHQATVLLAADPHQPAASELAVTGLKPRQLDAARGLLSSVGRETRSALVGALLPADPADLWTSGPDIASAGRAWAERLGHLVRLPEDVAAETAVTGDAVEAVLNPAHTPWLSRTTVQRPDKDGHLIAEDPSALPGRYAVQGAVTALSSLAYALPLGHPLRAALPGGLAALRRRMTDPELLLDLGLQWTERGGATAVELRKAYGLAESGGSDAQGFTRLGEALVLRPWHDTETVLVRPAGLTGPDDAVFGLLQGLVGDARGSALWALRTALGDELARAVTVDAGGREGSAQDPAVSVPGLVTEVAGTYGLGEDAASLYLQLLALPDPTDRNRARWTGWKPARTRKARADLAATDLVVEAKRPRAGRTLFLRCGWLDRKAPALPMEAWKEGLYPTLRHGPSVPLVPVAELFARAWERVRAGDAPAYEELTTRATRKGGRR